MEANRMNKTIGFIGCGSMGRAILAGIMDSGRAIPEQIMVSAATQETLDTIRDVFGTEVTLDNKKVAERSDILFLAIKPNRYEEIIHEIRNDLKEDAIIIGMAAGMTIEKMEKAFGKRVKIVRSMPNTPASVKEGYTAVVFNDQVTEVEKENMLLLFSSIGRAGVIEEKQMDVITGISGSSPAYVFMFIEAMADAAVKNGLPRKDAYEIASQAVLGAAKMVLETELHPGILKDMVCSPGGTTIEAVTTLEEKGFRHAVISAVDACIEKSKEMSKTK